MNVEFVMVADAAQVADGKLFVLGGGWTIYRCASFPAQVPFGVALSILFGPDEIGRSFPVSMVIADDAGVPIIPEMRGEISVGAQQVPVPDNRQLFAVNGMLQIPREGRYTVQVTAGTSTGRVYFNAIFSGTKITIPGVGRQSEGH